MKIDGKKIANIILRELKAKVKKLQEKKIIPHLAIILVGNDPASKIYVRQKMLTAEKVGIKASLFQYPDSATTNDLVKHLNDLNHLSKIHGVIVQQPLPLHINLKGITEAIDPKKDVDGFHPNSKFQSPIALAVLRILEKIYRKKSKARNPKSNFMNWLKSKKIVVIGKGETGGKPIIKMFKDLDLHPTVIDSQTLSPKRITKKADIIISAVGKPNIVKPNMLKKGVVLVSVGLHKGLDGKLHGDYNEEEIKNKASFYTPTPGGVGPVNVAMLLENLVDAAKNLYFPRCLI